MRLKEIEKRLKEIKEELNNEAADIEALKEEADRLIAERKEILEKAIERKKLLEEIARNHSAGEDVFDFEERKEQEKDSDEIYKRAFLKSLLSEELTKEERSEFTHTTENSGKLVPKQIQNKIYSKMEENHPILADVQMLRTGAVITIVKHTTIEAGDAGVVSEGDANDDEKNKFISVDLTGKDFAKHVEFSYRLGKMAIPAFEEYLVKEISERIGAAIAKDIIEQIKTDMNSSNKITAAESNKIKIEEVLKALGSLKGVGKVNVYCNSVSLYMGIANIKDAEGKLHFLPNMQENATGQLLGKQIKEEDALANGEILFLDPNKFIFNIVQDITIERAKDIKSHKNIISGIAIGSGTLTNDKAGALLTATIDA